MDLPWSRKVPGGMSLRTLKFSLLNFAGNKLPMGSTNMSFQLVFGFPET